MKQSLIILSSLTTLTLASNLTVNVVNSNTVINNNLTSNPSNNQTPTSVFNNRYGYLNQDSWITNQSITDGKYYSYDTSHAVGNLSDGTPMKNAFIVDSSGNLTIDSSLKLSDADKNMLNNIQAQMVSHKQVTSVKDDYNPYSKSVYSDSFFSGDNSNWKYLQMGGAENHIDISSQQSANKVEHSNSLSETLGLYYIAKAQRTPGGIDSTVANSLGKYFISQSSLKGSVDDSLTKSIINVIATNTNVYDLILDAPPIDGQTELYKNYSINYIFDSSNNLIQVYCNKWSTGNAQGNNMGYYWHDSYSAFSGFNDHSNTYILIKWVNYARDWDTFTKIYRNFTFDKDSNCSVRTNDNECYDECRLNGATTEIAGRCRLFSSATINTGPTFINVIFNLWHDDHNIYFSWSVTLDSSFGTPTILSVTINRIMFTNSMK